MIANLGIPMLLLMLAFSFSSSLQAEESDIVQSNLQHSAMTENLIDETPKQDPVLSKEAQIQQLAGAKLKKIPTIVEGLEKSLGNEGLAMFDAMLNNRLYYQKEDKKIVIIEKLDSGEYQLFDPLNQANLGVVKKSLIKKVKVNNKLRKQLRNIIARLSLFSNDAALRQSSVRSMLDKIDSETITILEKVRDQEQDEGVLALVDLAFAIYNFTESEEQSIRLAALDIMKGSLEPTVRNLLTATTEKYEDGSYAEEDRRVREKAKTVINGIEGKIKFYGFIEKVFFGLSLGSVLLLVATGLAITFGVMGVINMAHGELIMLGAYTTYVIQLLLPNYIEYSILLAIPAAFLVSGFVGILIERGVIRFLHGRPLETLLATFGISLVLQQTVRSIFSPLNRQVETPQWLSGSLEINSVLSITYNRLYILIFALIVFLILQLILKKTSLGLHVRAVSQNRNMAKSMGIRTEWVDAMTFGLGSGIAGIAGVALSQLTNVGPNLGQAYIIDSFMVVVFGGVGNLWGTLVGGFTLGITNKFLEPMTGAVLANILVLVFIILFIQKRPRGLFPQKGRAAD